MSKLARRRGIIRHVTNWPAVVQPLHGLLQILQQGKLHSSFRSKPFNVGIRFNRFIIFILGVGLSVGADSTPCSVSDNQLERKQPMCFFSTSLPSRAARLRFYARKDLRKGWTWRNAQCQAEGPEQAPCHQSKDAKLFLKEILTGQASSLILSGLRQGWSRWSQSWLKTFVCFQIRHWERSQIFMAWTIGTFSCKQFSLVKLLFDRLQLQRETMLPVDPRKIFSKLARCTRWGPLTDVTPILSYPP